MTNDTIITEVLRICKTDWDSVVKTRSRTAVNEIDAKYLIVFFLRKKCGVWLQDIGKMFGISHVAVRNFIQRLPERMESRRFNDRFNQMQQFINKLNNQ